MVFRIVLAQSETQSLVQDLNSVRQIQGSLNKFLDFFRMGSFIDSTHMKLKSPSK